MFYAGDEYYDDDVTSDVFVDYNYCDCDCGCENEAGDGFARCYECDTECV